MELSQMISGSTILGMVAASTGILQASAVNRIFIPNIEEDDTTSLKVTAHKNESKLPRSGWRYCQSLYQSC